MSVVLVVLFGIVLVCAICCAPDDHPQRFRWSAGCRGMIGTSGYSTSRGKTMTRDAAMS
jgi:hypothetical protein